MDNVVSFSVARREKKAAVYRQFIEDDDTFVPYGVHTEIPLWLDRLSHYPEITESFNLWQAEELGPLAALTPPSPSVFDLITPVVSVLGLSVVASLCRWCPSDRHTHWVLVTILTDMDAYIEQECSAQTETQRRHWVQQRLTHLLEKHIEPFVSTQHRYLLAQTEWVNKTITQGQTDEF